MLTPKRKFTSIDEYIDLSPAAVRPILQKIRQTIQAAAPDATEAISYQIPTFKLRGKNLIHFAAFQHHIGIYPTPSVGAHFAKEFLPYKKGKGSLQLPLDQTIPFDLISKIALFRREQLLKDSSAQN